MAGAPEFCGWHFPAEIGIPVGEVMKKRCLPLRNHLEGKEIEEIFMKKIPTEISQGWGFFP